MFSFRCFTKCSNQLAGKHVSTLFQQTSSIRSLYTENIGDIVTSRLPSIIWNADALHGLTKEQMDFRQSVRAFAEKELPEELVKKVRFVEMHDLYF